MSYDVSLVCPCCGTDVADHGFNYTYNMGYAIRHGGVSVYDKGEDGLFALEGAKASDAAEALRTCIERIERDAEELREREPSNGWGSVDGLVSRFLRPIYAACVEHPDCKVVAC